jgi:hypothetical protein
MNTAVAVETPKAKLVDELRAAEGTLHNAEIKLRIIEGNIKSGEQSVRNQELEIEKAPPAYRSDSSRVSLRRSREWVAGENEALPGAKDAVETARRHLAFVRSEIFANPLYASTLEKRRQFTARGIELARKAWAAPLLQVREFVRQFEAIADEEQNYILRENSRIAQAGLPELYAVLANYRHCLPEPIARMDLATLAKEAETLIVEISSR